MSSMANDLLQLPPPGLEGRYLGLYNCGLVMTFGLGLTFFFAESLHRHSFIINYLFLTGVFSLFASLSSIATRCHTGLQSNRSLAVAQASGLLGGAPAVALSDALLAVIMLLKVSPRQNRFVTMSETRWFTIGINILPWLVWVIGLVVGIVKGTAGAHNPENLIMPVGYWNLFVMPRYFGPWLYSIIIFFGATVIIDTVLLVVLFEHYRVQSTSMSLSVSSTAHSVQAEKKAAFRRHLGLAARCSALGVFFLCNLCLDAVIVSNVAIPPTSVQVYEATRGITIFFIFASQEDVIQLVLISAVSLSSSVCSIFTRRRRSTFAPSVQLPSTHYLPNSTHLSDETASIPPSKSTDDSFSSKLGFWQHTSGGTASHAGGQGDWEEGVDSKGKWSFWPRIKREECKMKQGVEITVETYRSSD